MDTIPQDTPQKQCSTCPNSYPATPEFFHRDKHQKDGLRPSCKECIRAYMQSYRVPSASRERKNAYMRVYSRRPEVHERKRAYRRIYDKAYYRQPEKREQRRIYDRSPKRRAYVMSPKARERKKVRMQVYMRVYGPVYRIRPESQERNRIYSSTREARKKSVSGSYTVAQIQDLLQRQKHKCYYCSKRFQRVKSRYIFHIEHTFPISRIVGTAIPANDISYLVLACPTCNLSKGDKFPWEWPEGGRLL